MRKRRVSNTLLPAPTNCPNDCVGLGGARRTSDCTSVGAVVILMLKVRQESDVLPFSPAGHERLISKLANANLRLVAIGQVLKAK